jgi:hypothetical protein
MADGTDLRVTKGGRKLIAHIRSEKTNIEKWCERHGFDRVGVTRLMNGDYWKRTTVDIAFELCRAANSEGAAIEIGDFRSSTAVRLKQRERRGFAAA